MRLDRSSKSQSFLYQIVPLLDVIFAVLVFFILSSTFILQPGLEITPPVSRYALEPGRNPLIISMTGGNSPQIFFRDQLIALENLAQELKNPSLKGRTMIIKADKAVPYDLVMQATNCILASGFEVVLAADTPPQPK